jgi:hypothetical protein
MKTDWQNRLHRSLGSDAAYNRVRGVLIAFPDVSFKQNSDGVFTAIRGSFGNVVEVVGALRKLMKEWSERAADVDASEEAETWDDACEDAQFDDVGGKPSPSRSSSKFVEGFVVVDDAAQSEKIFSIAIDVDECVWSYVEQMYRDELQKLSKDVTIRCKRCKVQLISISEKKLNEVKEVLDALLQETYKRDLVSWPIQLEVNAKLKDTVRYLLQEGAALCQGVTPSSATGERVPTTKTESRGDRRLCKYDVIAPRAVMCRVLPKLIDIVAQKPPRTRAESAAAGKSWWQLLPGISKSNTKVSADSTLINLYNFQTSCGLNVCIGRGSFSFMYLSENLQLTLLALNYCVGSRSALYEERFCD